MSSVVFRDPRRAEAVDLLAGSLYDLLHQPETWTGNVVRRGSTPDARNAHTIRCPACQGRRRTRDRFRRETPCVTCGGRLEQRDDHGKLLVRARLGTGRVKADTYTGDLVATETGDTPPRTVSWRCNICDGTGVEPRRRSPDGGPLVCRACGGCGRREVSPFTLRIVDPDRVPDPETVVERAIEARDQAGDYHPLERALADLRRHDRPAHRVYWQARVVFGLRDQDLTPSDRLLLDQARRFLLDRMPAVIRVPRWVLDNERERRKHPGRVRGRGADSRALQERDAAIRDRDRAGVAAAAIAVEFGLSTSRVYAILRRSERNAA